VSGQHQDVYGHHYTHLGWTIRQPGEKRSREYFFVLSAIRIHSFPFRGQNKMKKNSQKFNKRPMAGTMAGKTKREGQKKAKRCIVRGNQEKDKVYPSRGRKLFHPRPF